MNSGKYYSTGAPGCVDSGQSTASQSQVTSGSSPPDKVLVDQRESLTREVDYWKERYQ